MRHTSIAMSLCLLLIAPAIFAADGKPTEADFAVSDGVKIHYYVMGKGTPVILIHGYTGTAWGNWFSNGIAQALAKNHMVVALDCRNHGKSDKPVANGPGKAEDVVELMDQVVPAATVKSSASVKRLPDEFVEFDQPMVPPLLSDQVVPPGATVPLAVTGPVDAEPLLNSTSACAGSEQAAAVTSASALTTDAARPLDSKEDMRDSRDEARPWQAWRHDRQHDFESPWEDMLKG